MGQQLATFSVGSMHFGVDVLEVQEVLREQAMTHIPTAPEVVRGLINLRGQIVTAIDMRMRLRLPPLESGPPLMNMIIRTEDGAASLLVDEIGDVIEVSDSSYEECPENLAPSVREIVLGVHKMKESLLLLLDTAKALDVSS
ncbi:MAG TPA: chemotaxis protein CheW [Bryobacteraceae bacterium]|nr:chemotaxis protein CheW [Bryobacteraceae bacterium]